MRPVVVFALYVWLAVSATALVVQQIRRVLHRRAKKVELSPDVPTTPAEPAVAESIPTEPAAPVTPTTIFERLTQADPPVSETRPVPEPTPLPKRPARGLAETLAGIHLPCELLPVVPKGVSPSDNTVSLVTTSAPPEVVGPAIADELERLGYELDAVSASRLIARRDPDALTLDMILSPDQLEHEGVALYPGVNPDAVLVVIAIGEPTS